MCLQMDFIFYRTILNHFFFADERVLFHVEAEPKKVYYVRGAARAFPIPGFSPYIVLGGFRKNFVARAGTLIWAPSSRQSWEFSADALSPRTWGDGSPTRDEWATFGVVVHKDSDRRHTRHLALPTPRRVF